MKYAVIVFNIILCAVVVTAATKGLNTPDVPLHRAEFMSDWFHGNLIDWIGLALFSLTVMFNCIAGYFELSVYNEVGSSGKTVLIGFVLPLVWVLLIYLG